LQSAPVLEAHKTDTSPLHLKTVVMTLVVTLSSVIGNFSLAWGMRRVAPNALQSPLGYIQVLFDPWVALGVSMLVLWLLSQMALLSWADLSYVLPVTSAGYVLTAITAWLFLNEQISRARWAGVTLIMAGVVLVGRTQHSTTLGNGTLGHGNTTGGDV
jgi:drug/metabolite transporter (DMT)-like permease